MMLAVLVLLGGCADPIEDPVLVALTNQDTVWESLERVVRPVAYWTRKVTELEKSAEEARKAFQGHHEAYRNGLLTRREAVLKAVQEARGRQEKSDEARQEAIQHHRSVLAHARDEARNSGRNLRIRLALLRKAQEQLDRSR